MRGVLENYVSRNALYTYLRRSCEDNVRFITASIAGEIILFIFQKKRKEKEKATRDRQIYR